MKREKIVDQEMTEILGEVTANMRELYAEVNSEATDLKMADSLANIAGKILKAQQLILAREIFVQEKSRLLAPPAKS